MHLIQSHLCKNRSMLPNAPPHVALMRWKQSPMNCHTTNFTAPFGPILFYWKSYMLEIIQALSEISLENLKPSITFSVTTSILYVARMEIRQKLV